MSKKVGIQCLICALASTFIAFLFLNHKNAHACILEFKNEIQDDVDLERDVRENRPIQFLNDFDMMEEHEWNIESKCIENLKFFQNHSSSKLNIVFFIMVFSHIDFVEKIVKRLTDNFQYVHRHAIMLHVDLKVNRNMWVGVKELSRKVPNVCIVQSGNIVYRSASEMRTIHAYEEWLLGFPHWDVFVPMTGKDYLLVDIYGLEKMLEKVGPEKTWVRPYAKPLVTQSQPGATSCCLFEDSNCAISDYHQRASTYVLPCKDGTPHVAPASNWLYTLEKTPFYFCAALPMFTGFFSRQFLSFIHRDPTSEMFYRFWRLRGIAAVEHYYPSLIYNLIQMKKSSTHTGHFHFAESCVMSWTRGLEADGCHNTILTINEVDLIQDAAAKCTPMARKFKPEHSERLLHYIDTQLNYSHCFFS